MPDYFRDPLYGHLIFVLFVVVLGTQFLVWGVTLLDGWRFLDPWAQQVALPWGCGFASSFPPAGDDLAGFLLTFGFTLLVSMVWLTLASVAYKRFRTMRMNCYRIADPPVATAPFPTVGATALPFRALVWAASKGEAINQRRVEKRWSEAATGNHTGANRWNFWIGMVFGAADLLLIRVFGLCNAYPWDVLSFFLGFSGGVLISELVLYGMAVTHFLPRSRKAANPLHPDGFGGLGPIAEQMSSLASWLLALGLVSHLIFIPPPAWTLLAEVSPIGKAVLGVFSILTKMVLLFIFFAAYMVTHDLLNRARRDAIAEAGRMQNPNALKAALAMARHPAIKYPYAKAYGSLLLVSVSPVLNELAARALQQVIEYLG